jgi:hypothetical protein
MWPLIFSREEMVRKAVLDSWYRLFLADRPPKQQVSRRYGAAKCADGTLMIA